MKFRVKVIEQVLAHTLHQGKSHWYHVGGLPSLAPATSEDGVGPCWPIGQVKEGLSHVLISNNMGHQHTLQYHPIITDEQSLVNHDN